VDIVTLVALLDIGPHSLPSVLLTLTCTYPVGFLLDGGVHNAALIRTVIPSPPELIISTASLHRKHLVPHDTVQALALSPSTTTDPHGSVSSLQGIREISEIPNGMGRATANGTILFTVANPDIDAAQKHHNGLTITCQNGVVKVINLQTGSSKVGKASAGWRVEVIPGKGTDVQGRVEEGEKTGVRDEIALFGYAIAASKAGKPFDETKMGEPRNMLWDVALVEAMLTSNGEKVDLQKLVAGDRGHSEHCDGGR
jgi:hypothetical protein